MPSLVTKLPEGKDPVICICFEKHFEAQKTNEDLVLKFSKDEYTINIWPTDSESSLVNLMLISLDDPKNQRLYKNLSFNYPKLEWWLKHTEHNTSDMKFKFTHIVSEFGKDRVVRTYDQRKLFVLNVAKCVVKGVNDLAF